MNSTRNVKWFFHKYDFDFNHLSNVFYVLVGIYSFAFGMADCTYIMKITHFIFDVFDFK